MSTNPISEERKANLAAKMQQAFAAVDQPNRNARSMLVDPGVWANVAAAIMAAVEGTDVGEEPAAPVAVADTGEADGPEAEDDEDDGETSGGDAPKKRGRKAK